MDYPINTKIGDENFTRLLAGYQPTPQGKKNTITALRKLVKRRGKDVFYITRNDAETFYDSCISDIHNGTYKPLYIKTVMHSLKAFYRYINDLSQNGSLDQSFPCCYNGNPFGDIVINIPDKLEYQEADFPSMESISGYGRYDVMLEPVDKNGRAFIFEFKVLDPDEDENTLEDTLAAAHRQITEKRYETELVSRGFAPEKIRSYGFAFRGRECLIG